MHFTVSKKGIDTYLEYVMEVIYFCTVKCTLSRVYIVCTFEKHYTIAHTYLQELANIVDGVDAIIYWNTYKNIVDRLYVRIFV